MNEKQILLIGCVLLISLIVYCPIGMINAEGDTVPVAMGGTLDVNLGTERSSVKGSYSATGSVVAWISDSYGETSPPPDAVWNTTGISGSFDVSLIEGIWYHLNFYNPTGETVDITYNLEEDIIPGFQLLFILIGLSALSLFILKKKSIF